MLKLIEEQDDLMRGIILVFKLFNSFGFMFCIFVLLICNELLILLH